MNINALIIDFILSGRGDLSIALGFPGQKNHPIVLSVEEKIFDKAKSKGIAISPQLDTNTDNFDGNISTSLWARLLVLPNYILVPIVQIQK